MVRIRCTGGALTPAQLRRVAEISIRYGTDSIHVTTRQELQIHDVVLENIIPLMRALLQVNLSTRGGGNTVRNIIASFDSGIQSEEVFDVMPYVTALTNRLITDKDSWNLPRKYMIAFSSCAEDNAHATVQDLGFIAQIQNGQRGFKVFVAGGMGARPIVGHELYDFISVKHIYRVALALKHLFDAHGNRKNKHAARLRFLYQDLGQLEFERLFNEEMNLLQDDVFHLCVLHDDTEDSLKHDGVVKAPLVSNRKWYTDYVTPQKQYDRYSIKIPLRLGDMLNRDVIRLIDSIAFLGDDAIRFSMDQNIHIRLSREDIYGYW